MTPTNDTPASRAGPDGVADILDFWFADGLEKGWPTADMKELWWGGSKDLDDTVRQKFGALVNEALAGRLSGWEAQPLSRLALVLLLDQFTRNVFRGSAQAFAGDGRTQKLVSDGLAKGWDQGLPLVGRVFFYMPLMHAEAIALQDECVNRFKKLLTEGLPEQQKTLQGNLNFAIQHRDIIARFGRFPHRNGALNRATTADEDAFLKTGPRFGQ